MHISGEQSIEYDSNVVKLLELKIFKSPPPPSPGLTGLNPASKDDKTKSNSNFWVMYIYICDLVESVKFDEHRLKRD